MAGSSKKKPGVQLNDDQIARIPFHNRYGCCICRKARTQRVLAVRSAIEIKLTSRIRIAGPRAE